ncbi:MAG: hypothetical protein F2518_09220, partial [Actinobacteria bacterium]|nr:hypothetical protein [Actinomycetota bacterium]
MSADSIDLDGLERKDRSELAVIATALGGKPTSRVKKADIITMILDLAGVTPSDGESADAGSADPGSDRSEDSAGETATAKGERAAQDASPS